MRTLGEMDSLRQILRAAAIAVFTVGVLLMLINPPSLSGLGGLVSFLVGGVAVVLLAAWATVALMGRTSMSEREFDELVEHSEALARRPPQDPVEREPTEFEQLVADAIDRLPPEFQEMLEATPVVVSTRGAAERAYGQYWGGNFTRGDHEHRILIFQDTLERDFGHDPDVLRDQVERTLRHEVAHHLGWDERGVRGLGL